MPKRVLRNPDELSTNDLATYLGVQAGTIYYWLREGKIPEPRRQGNKRIWSRAEAAILKKRITI